MPVPASPTGAGSATATTAGNHMSPIQEAARRVVAQFEVHQSLRLLMQNTLAAIIETEVGPLVMKAEKERGEACAERDRLRSEHTAQLAELHTISEALGTNEGHSSVEHIRALRTTLAEADRLRIRCEACEACEAMPAAGFDT